MTQLSGKTPLDMTPRAPQKRKEMNLNSYLIIGTKNNSQQTKALTIKYKIIKLLEETEEENFSDSQVSPWLGYVITAS